MLLIDKYGENLLLVFYYFENLCWFFHYTFYFSFQILELHPTESPIKALSVSLLAHPSVSPAFFLKITQ